MRKFELDTILAGAISALRLGGAIRPIPIVTTRKRQRRLAAISHNVGRDGRKQYWLKGVRP